MPEITENVRKWSSFGWRQGGDEWSEWWGGAKSQWRGTVFPRIERFVPVGLLVEIAPGYGRWTQFLRHHCDELIGIDLDRACVEACRSRFRGDERLVFHENDGKTLVGVPDRAVGLVFSFDSLVHAEQDVMDAYLRELARVLTDDGVAFLHHSNLASYTDEEMNDLWLHWRARSVSAETVRDSAARAGLSCFRQELIRWGGNHQLLNDCFTWIARSGAKADGPRELISNPAFMDEAQAALAHARRWKRFAPRSAWGALRRRAGRLPSS